MINDREQEGNRNETEMELKATNGGQEIRPIRRSIADHLSSCSIALEEQGLFEINKARPGPEHALYRHFRDEDFNTRLSVRFAYSPCFLLNSEYRERRIPISW